MIITASRFSSALCFAGRSPQKIPTFVNNTDMRALAALFTQRTGTVQKGHSSFAQKHPDGSFTVHLSRVDIAELSPSEAKLRPSGQFQITKGDEPDFSKQLPKFLELSTST